MAEKGGKRVERGEGERPRMLFADDHGRIYDHPFLEMVGFDGERYVLPDSLELVPLPEFSKLFYYPGCPPYGFDPRKGVIRCEPEVRMGGRWIRCHAVAAFPEPGYVRTLLPAAECSRKHDVLPLWAYTAAGFASDGYRIAAFRVESNPCWDPRNFDDEELMPVLQGIMRRKKKNRLFRHLRRCALYNHCFAAKNLFLGRWEAPLPVSRRCNARCLGCLSFQDADACPPSHQRIAFRPTVEEILEVAVPHLETAENAIVSFGQGCEGEPLMEAELIAAAIREMRRRTERGTVNLNTNGSLPSRLAQVVDAGLDSVRISLSSARPAWYHAYYRPSGYRFEDVREAARLCADAGCFTMINYLVFPGVTDEEEEVEAFLSFLEATGAQFVHFKNLCIDPVRYLHRMPYRTSSLVGIRNAYLRLREAFPQVSIGYFNQPVESGSATPPPASPRKGARSGSASPENGPSRR